MLTLLHIMAILSFDDMRNAQTKLVDVPPGKIYHLREVHAHGSEPFCLSVVERRGAEPMRATYLGCHHAGDAVAKLQEPPIIGGKDTNYVIVVFRPNATFKPSTVIVDVDIEREKRP